MKYYNKEWYELIEKAHYTVGIEPIEDKEYTKEDILELYNKKLKEEIELAREEYNTPPDFEDLDDILDEELESWLLIDEQSGNVKEPISKEEILKSIELEKQEAMKEFEQREEFDEDIIIEGFKELYNLRLKEEGLLPKWVYDEVDKKIIVLDYLPKSVYDKLLQEENEATKKLEKINIEASEVLNKQDIPEEIIEEFRFHDSLIKSFEKNNNDYEMRLDTYDMFSENENKKILFKNAEIIELEEFEDEYTYYLYEEIYSIENGYEVHMMVWSNGLKYITLKCEDIEIIEE